MQSKNTKSKRTVKRRTSPPGCSTQKSHLFTTEEYQKIIAGACKARLQTENDILAVIKHAEELRINSLILESVLDGGVAMYAGSDGQIMFCKSNPTGLRCAGLDAHKQDPVVQPSESDLK